MERAVIEKTILDTLIRAKLASLPDCNAVEALPVAWQAPVGPGCNWHVPGWTGPSGRVGACASRVAAYLQFLQAQFDIPAEDTAPQRKRPGV